MTKIVKRLEELLEFIEYRNEMSPFPIFDTEYVQEIRNKINEMKKVEEYDNLPVVACKHCKSLHIISDEVENDVCMRCGAVNEIEIYENIKKYMESTDDKVY